MQTIKFCRHSRLNILPTQFRAQKLPSLSSTTNLSSLGKQIANSLLCEIKIREIASITIVGLGVHCAVQVGLDG